MGTGTPTEIIWESIILAVLFTLSIVLQRGKNQTTTIIKYGCLGLGLFLAFYWLFYNLYHI